MKKTLIKSLMLLLVVAIACTFLASCVKKPFYEITDTVDISIKIADGQAVKITNEVLKKVEQKEVDITITKNGEEINTTYVGYCVGDIVKALSLNIPAVTNIFGDDGNQFNSGMVAVDTLDRSFIAFAIKVDNKYAKDDNGPRFIPDKDSKISKQLVKSVKNIIINPVD